MTKDNWIKAWNKESNKLLKYLHGNECLPANFDEVVVSFTKKVKKDAIEKTKQELKGFDTGRNWYFEGDELVITRGKWVIDRYKKHEREEDL